jgi:protein-tyrosine-phosphatase
LQAEDGENSAARSLAKVHMRAAMRDNPFNVLFLCTGNSARSIMAEAILNKVGAGQFQAFSAGIQPKGHVHPEAARLLQSLGYDTTRYRSKSWNELAQPGAPALDFVFTVCDNAAGEACPFWPGQPMTAHRGIPDPSADEGSPAEVALAFKDAYRMLSQRIGVFAAIPIRSLDELSLQAKLKEIGRMDGATARVKEPGYAFACATCDSRISGHSPASRCRGRLRHHGAASGGR